MADKLVAQGWDRRRVVKYLRAMERHQKFQGGMSYLASKTKEQISDMGGGIGVIVSGDFGMAREQIIEDGSEQYKNRILMHQLATGGEMYRDRVSGDVFMVTKNGGDLDEAISSASGKRMAALDMIGANQFFSGVDKIDSFDARSLTDMEATQNKLIGGGSMLMNAAAVTSLYSSFRAGWMPLRTQWRLFSRWATTYRGVGMREAWAYATTLKVSNKYFSLGGLSAKERLALARLAQARAEHLMKTLPKRKWPRGVTATYDPKTGTVYYTTNGQFSGTMHPSATARCGFKSYYGRPVTRCAEPKGYNAAMMNGANPDELEMFTVRVSRNGTVEPFPRCWNCRQSTLGITAVSDLYKSAPPLYLLMQSEDLFIRTHGRQR